MENRNNNQIEQKYKKLVIVLSIVIPLAVAVLFNIELKGYDFSFLPPIYSIINTVVAILLVLAVISIKKGNKTRHRLFVRFAILGSVLFLVGYILYHATAGDTKYGGEGIVKYNYFFILITHIILSIAVIPMVMLTYLKGWANNIESHKKLAKYTFPLWLYVAVTGPVIYLMISPYYA
jgi:putative membrane protein